MSLKSKDHRYGSVAIAMHWVTAGLIVILFATGLQAAAQTDEAAKVALLRAHVPLGIGVLLLTALRIVWRLLADRGGPRSPALDPAWRRLLARAVHIGLYVVVVMTGVSGFATVATSGAMPAIISGAALPDLAAVPPSRDAHPHAAPDAHASRDAHWRSSLPSVHPARSLARPNGAGPTARSVRTPQRHSVRIQSIFGRSK